jgi:MFS family permease
MPNVNRRRQERDIFGRLLMSWRYPFGLGIGSSLSIANSLHNNSQHSTQVIAVPDLAQFEADGGWIAASYPLTSGTFVLIVGRLGEVYGHKIMLAAGSIW